MDREKSAEQKAFDLDLTNASDLVQEKYHKLLLEAQLEGAKKNKGATVTISLEERKGFLNRAEQIACYGNADPKKMAQDWGKYNRPPIGGAQDN